MTLKVCMQHPVLEFCQIFSSDGSRLILTYFMARSNLVPYAFVWEKVKTMDFSETVVVYDIKVGRCSQQNENLTSTKGQGHSLTLAKSLRFNIFKLLFLNNC